MTDLEICKRIVEIEYANSEKAGWDYSDCGTYIVDSLCNEFNPLTDKALCFDLMVKHGVKLAFGIEPLYTANARDCTIWTKPVDNPQRAICLAIIAKHGLMRQTAIKSFYYINEKHHVLGSYTHDDIKYLIIKKWYRSKQRWVHSVMPGHQFNHMLKIGGIEKVTGQTT